MRINTSGNKEWRTDLFEETAEALDESTKTKGITKACEHTKQDIEAKADLLEWMESNLTVSEAQEICEILSTRQVAMSLSAESDMVIE